MYLSGAGDESDVGSLIRYRLYPTRSHFGSLVSLRWLLGRLAVLGVAFLF